MSDGNWIFDSLVQFLKGPVWNVPILTFIENKSMIFESDSDFEGSADEFKTIHDQYKNLVDLMLGSYMEDMGITPEQFETACGNKNNKSEFHQTLFEQVWAADDFEIFKRMMIQKNLELQLQALEILQHKYGLTPKSFIADGTLPPDESAILEQVLKISLEEHNAMKADMDAEKKALEKTLALSEAEKNRLENEKWIENQKRQKGLNLPKLDEASAPPAEAPSSGVSSEDIEKRKEYLKEQRDKLLQLKRTERMKQLKDYESSTSRGRPKSSIAANRAMAGSNIDPQTLQIRKALAARLKDEVIDN